jgi:hypothetical protein
MDTVSDSFSKVQAQKVGQQVKRNLCQRARALLTGILLLTPLTFFFTLDTSAKAYRLR